MIYLSPVAITDVSVTVTDGLDFVLLIIYYNIFIVTIVVFDQQMLHI